MRRSARYHEALTALKVGRIMIDSWQVEGSVIQELEAAASK
jgi:hypothetical protein